MKLYVLTVAAMQDKDEQTHIGMQTATALLPDDADVEDVGLQTAHDLFPPSDGWHDHHTQATEITQGFPFDAQRLYWFVVDEEEMDEELTDA